MTSLFHLLVLAAIPHRDSFVTVHYHPPRKPRKSVIRIDFKISW